MSRTHRHAPWWVQIRDPRLRGEHHDHRDGPCDLPDIATWVADPDRLDRRCSYRYRFESGPNICGCPMCTQAPYRKAARRRERHEGRRAAHHASRGR